MKKLGLIVNPIAGMGGRVGLKGSDGREILERARALGAQPEALARVVRALESVVPIRDLVEIITYPYDMGEQEALACGLSPKIIGSVRPGETTADDTRKAAKEMEALGIDLILFAGGDGTARDIFTAVGDKVPVLGIPTGVKMHSAVYATSPRNAGELARLFLDEKSLDIRLTEGEVMDIDEASFRKNQLTARLYGYLKIPFKKRLIQCPKDGSCAGEQEALNAIAADVINNMERGCLYIIGTGTTTRAIMEKLELPNTLLGVDAVYDRRLAGTDLNESRLLEMIRGRKAKIVVSIIGRQGYIFGRGNQQISARVIKGVGGENIIVIATMEKILTLGGDPLLVDTGEIEVDQMLTGYATVVTGLGEKTVLKVES
ncbi:MAG: ATP-NAD kinase [Deltaproteobacteria bacterium]|nr:MAG: ATP-NAD kinase [Deltaproteobacteria bacterium]